MSVGTLHGAKYDHNYRDSFFKTHAEMKARSNPQRTLPEPEEQC